MSVQKSLALLAILAVGSGCSLGPHRGVLEESPAPAELRDLNDLLHAGSGPGGRPPTRLSDLDKHRTMFPHAYEAVPPPLYAADLALTPDDPGPEGDWARAQR